MFTYTNTNKRYHTLDYFYKKKFGSKVFKISLNGGFTCPNIDGTVGYGGCIFCSEGSGHFAGKKEDDILVQFDKIKKMMKNKWDTNKYIGYFQANTNTHAKVERLKELYEPVIAQEGVVGLNIGTRPDAISDECLEYLNDLNKRCHLTVELGLQTIKKETTKLINRCSNIEIFDEMIEKLRERNIDVVLHIINGLPNETEEDMLNTIKYINSKDIQGVKIHMLSITKHTALEKIYKVKPFHILTIEEYVDIVIKQLELLRPEIVIHRITGDPDKNELIEPTWLIKKFVVLNEIDKEMKRRNTYQGIKYERIPNNN